MSEINLVSVSGGKDSTALLLLAMERAVDNLRCVFADTGNELPETYAYLEYLESVTGQRIERVQADFTEKMAGKRAFIRKKWAEHGVPQHRIDRALEVIQPTGNPFLDLCLWKGRFPSSRTRFCTQELKVLPIEQQVVIPTLKEGHTIRSWQGVRAEESRARAQLDEEEVGDPPGVTIYRPLLRWTAAEVFAMHRKHHVEPNPLYKQGMGRVGCAPCINVRKAELREIANRFPEVIERIAEWERLVSEASKRGSTTFMATVTVGAESDDDVSPETHGIEYAVQWARTTHGGRQYDLLPDDEPTMCSSQYGLCE